MERVLRRRETLHLAAAAAHDGHLPPHSIDAALRAGRILRRGADHARPDIVVAAATSALRDATNGDHLIDKLQIAIRSSIRVLDGFEEAILVYAGARAGVPALKGDLIVADLGGGSLEFAVGKGKKITETATFPLGASRMTALHVAGDPMSEDEQRKVVDVVRNNCADFFTEIRPRLPLPVVVAGGTARAIGRIVAAEADHEERNGHVIPAAELNRVARKLAGMKRPKRMSLPGMRERRVDVLPTGALILAAAIEELDAGAITVSEWGLREGLLLEALSDAGEVPILLAN